MTKPRLVIASSSEQIKAAKALNGLLSRNFETTPWWTLFRPGNLTLDEIIETFGNQDFGVVILGPDDTTNSRGESKPSPRDNAIFELGILVGLLGRERVFWVVDRSNPVKLPSDLGGITPVDYDSQRSDSNLKAALDEAANMIEETAERLGRRPRYTLSTEVSQTATKNLHYGQYSTHVEISKSEYDGYFDATYSIKRTLKVNHPTHYWSWSLARRPDSDTPYNHASIPVLTPTSYHRSGNGECRVQDFHSVTSQLAFRVKFEPELQPNEEFSIEAQIKITAFKPATRSGLRKRSDLRVPTRGDSDFVYFDISDPIDKLDFSVTIPRDLGTYDHRLEAILNQAPYQDEVNFIKSHDLFTRTLDDSSNTWTMQLNRDNPPLRISYRLCWTLPV